MRKSHEFLESARDETVFWTRRQAMKIIDIRINLGYTGSS